MDSFPFTRQTSRDFLMSAEDTGRALKSTLTEGSSRILDSVMDARRGIVDGLTSTFDKAVNMAGHTDEENEATESYTSSIQSSSSETVLEGSNSHRAKPFVATAGRQKPAKPPPPMRRQCSSDLDSNGSVKPLGKMSRQNTAPSGYDDDSYLPGRHTQFIRDGSNIRANNNTEFKTASDYDKSVATDVRNSHINNVTADIHYSSYPNHATSPSKLHSDVGQMDYPQNQIWSGSSGYSGDSSYAQNITHIASEIYQNYSNVAHRSVDKDIPAGNTDMILPHTCAVSTQRKIHPPKASRGGGESDVESESTEGCDEERNEEDFVGEDLSESARATTSVLESDEGKREQAWNESEGVGDQSSVQCQEFMSNFVQKIFGSSGPTELTMNEKARFGELCQNPIGRLWFARCINGQRVHSKRVSEVTLLNLVQFFSLTLFECNESDDYSPAKTLMNMCFTFYYEDARGQKQLLYSLLKDQAIWQSQRFWNAAFFYAVQHERAIRPVATSEEQFQTRDEDMNFQENIMFGQLGTFTCNMRSLGVSKEHCLDFLRKQSTIANLSAAQVRLLRENMEHWTDMPSLQ